MHFVRKMVAVGLAVTVLTSGPSAVALAAAPTDTASPPGRYSVRCEEGSCTVKTSLPGVPDLVKAGAGAVLTAIRRQPNILPAGASVSIDDDLLIKLPVGEVKLPNARITLELGPDKQIERLHGTAEVPFPSFGVLDNVTVSTSARAEVGLDIGKNLSYLNAPLEAERRYLFFMIGSGFDVAAETDTATKQFEIAVPAGQSATLVIDTQEPLVYLAGNFTVTHDGQMALVGKLIEPIQGLGVLPSMLPVRSRTQITASGLFSQRPGDDAVKVGAAHAIDAGTVGQWIGVELQPLAVEGLLTVSRQGMLINGLASSSIAPKSVWDAGVKLDAYIPFDGVLEDAYVQLEGRATVPFANVSADANAKVTWPPAVEASAHVTTPFSSSVAASRPGTTGVTPPSAAKQLLASTGQRVAQGAHAAGNAAERSGRWLTQNVTDGVSAMTAVLPWKTVGN